jgi:hypothetical protein
MPRFGLRDDQWDRIKDVLPGREGLEGVDCVGQSAVRGGRAVSAIGATLVLGL